MVFGIYIDIDIDTLTYNNYRLNVLQSGVVFGFQFAQVV